MVEVVEPPALLRHVAVKATFAVLKDVSGQERIKPELAARSTFVAGVRSSMGEHRAPKAQRARTMEERRVVFMLVV